MQVAVLLSPAAGRGRAHAAARGVLDALRAAGLTPRVLPATSRAAAERQAAEAVTAGTAAVVAIGGDGAAHAGLQAVAGTDTPLAVVPAGTGNTSRSVSACRPTRPAPAAERTFPPPPWKDPVRSRPEAHPPACEG